MTAYESARSALLACPNFKHGTGATELELDEAQRELGAFPADYLQFVREFGYGYFKSFEIWGIGSGVPARGDLLAHNRREHDDYGLPQDLIAIHNNGAGDLTGFKRDMPSSLELWTYWHDD
ncbi:SMI1/KNR4 family protein [Herbiconiux liukaitaii]|uniref:SMI1/KNR4 family protein n=1 Tax=Herbiconiux liukaitaii TaxID=3342799 RepID=UPI0035B6D546